MKQPHSKPKPTDAERHKRFVETAKKVEASEHLTDFDDAFMSLCLRRTQIDDPKPPDPESAKSRKE
jgi:hypothetical protein